MKAFIGKYIRRVYWLFKRKSKHVKIGGKCNISCKCNFEGYNCVGENTLIHSSKIGYGSYLGKNCYLIYCYIGKFCSIGDNINILAAQHPLYTCVSTHPAFYSVMKQAGFSYTEKQKFNEIIFQDAMNMVSVIIGSDVWIGDNVSIKGGVKIGDGAVVGANSLVLKDIEPYSIYGGVPAKKIGYRFEKSEIDELMKIKWWDWDLNKIKEKSSNFFEVEEFIKEERA